MAFPEGMPELRSATDHRRNRNFAETHRQLIERAVAMVGNDGVDALSVATLARDAGMNRSTVYYHFDSREALLAEVKRWVSSRLSEMLTAPGDPAARLEMVITFVLARPVLIHLWLMDMISGGDINEHFPRWSVLVGMLEGGLRKAGLDGVGQLDTAEAEVWATVLVSSAIMAPRLFIYSVRRQDDKARIAQRFAQAFTKLQRVLIDRG